MTTKHSHPMTTLPPDHFDDSPPTHSPASKRAGLLVASIALLAAFGLVVYVFLSINL